jgi:gas vesicle protein
MANNMWQKSNKHLHMKNSSKILIAIGAGVAIGGLMGLLFAPDKGAETRKKMAEAGKKLTDALKDQVSKGKEKMSGLKERMEAVNDKAEELV